MNKIKFTKFDLGLVEANPALAEILGVLLQGRMEFKPLLELIYALHEAAKQKKSMEITLILKEGFIDGLNRKSVSVYKSKYGKRNS